MQPSALSPADNGRKPRAAAQIRLRLYSGLVLMTFTVMHLLNHTLGLISLEALERGRQVFNWIWGPAAVEVLLLAAFALHGGLGLLSLWRRTTWRMPAWEAVQLLLGLLIPVLGTLHIVGVALVELCCEMRATYEFVLTGLWPDLALRQTALTLVVWAHGCIGLHYWLRLKPGYARWQPALLVIAVLLPVLALVGFLDGARALSARAALDPAWLPALQRQQNWPGMDVVTWIYRLERYLVAGFVLLVAAILAGDLLRFVLSLQRTRVRVSYAGGRTYRVPRGATLLDASRMNGIGHSSVCGGRGRCSTCRVRVMAGLDRLPPPSADERRVLERIGAGPDVRLACQLRPTHDVTVALLLPAGAATHDVMRRMDPHQGVEREIVVMFADLRNFTRLAETRLPYDVVFILNRYLSVMGSVIERHGGHVDKFVGDGIMALFGTEGEVRDGARGSLAAAAEMADALQGLNRELAHDLGQPLRMGIGMHAGPAIVGELGWRRTGSLTAIGDTVNIASRLESATKELGVELAISGRLAEAAGTSLPAGRQVEIELRGRQGTLPVLAFARARDASPTRAAPQGAPARSGLNGLLGRLTGRA